VYVQNLTSLPFGDWLDNGQGLGADWTPLNFTGQFHDFESNLDYFGARYYGSSLGRFMSPDGPFSDQNKGNPQSWNLYAYARNNPLRFTDADGRACVQQTDGSFKTVGTEGQSCEEYDAEEAADTHVASAIVTPSHDDQIKMFAEDIGNIGTAELKQDVLIMGVGVAGVAADAGIGILGARGAVVGATAQDLKLAEFSAILRAAAAAKGMAPGAAERVIVTAAEAEELGKAWVGPGSRVASDGKTLVSSNGLRIYRPPTFKEDLGKVQANLEQKIELGGRPISNFHLDIK
jgi:RHS repeat-associated protein